MITQDESLLPKIIDIYPQPIDIALYSKMTGIEIFRRIIGLAQLPLNRTLDEKKDMLAFAHKLITE
jgi:5-methylthioribose kinase